jgi:hypothetical protein
LRIKTQNRPIVIKVHHNELLPQDLPKIKEQYVFPRDEERFLLEAKDGHLSWPQMKNSISNYVPEALTLADRHHYLQLVQGLNLLWDADAYDALEKLFPSNIRDHISSHISVLPVQKEFEDLRDKLNVGDLLSALCLLIHHVTIGQMNQHFVLHSVAKLHISMLNDIKQFKKIYDPAVNKKEFSDALQQNRDTIRCCEARRIRPRRIRIRLGTAFSVPRRMLPRLGTGKGKSMRMRFCA